MLLTEPMKMPRPVARSIARAPNVEPLPAEVELIMSAIDTGQHGKQERRCAPRFRYRVQASLKLFSDLPDTPPWTLYSRDVNPRGMGFITQHRLPLGYGGLLGIVVPNGRILSIACTLLRCREAAPGWFEGSLYFNRQQTDFAAF